MLELLRTTPSCISKYMKFCSYRLKYTSKKNPPYKFFTHLSLLPFNENKQLSSSNNLQNHLNIDYKQCCSFIKAYSTIPCTVIVKIFTLILYTTLNYDPSHSNSKGNCSILLKF